MHWVEFIFILLAGYALGMITILLTILKKECGSKRVFTCLEKLMIIIEVAFTKHKGYSKVDVEDASPVLTDWILRKYDTQIEYKHSNENTDIIIKL